MKEKLIIEIYKRHLNSKNFKIETLKRYVNVLKIFLSYLKKIPLDIREVKEKNIYEYIVTLNERISRSTKLPLSAKYKAHEVSIIKDLFGVLYVEGYLIRDTGKNIEYRKGFEIKDKVILSQKEMGLLLNSIETETPEGLRDRTIYELLYAAGLRIGELGNLKLKDIDLTGETLYIWNGKKGKDRTVPIVDVALYFLKKYIKVITFKNEDKLFSICPNTINRRLKIYAEKDGVMKKGFTCHSFRHSLATHLLENNAGIRYVQEMLGHESIESTMVYTHMNIKELKKIYKSYHPGENNLYREGGEEYRKRIEGFVERLLKEKRKRKEKY